MVSTEPPGPAVASTPVAPDERGSFRADVTPRGIPRAIREFVARLRSGDPGGLPSVLGLIVLGVIFAATTKDFLTKINMANLTAQASFIALLAMGLVFVLLIGEIDLSAGTTAGMCAGFAAQSLQSGDLHAAVGGPVFYLLLFLMLGTAVLGVLSRSYVGPAIIVLGIILMVTGVQEDHQLVAFLFALSIGVAVGTLSGVLVARLGIPSFIVTLALFLAWEGVQLYALKNQSISTSNYSIWFDLTHGSMSVWAGWVLFAVLAGGYLVFTAVRAVLRGRAGLSHDTPLLVLTRAGVIIVLGGFVTWFLNQNRSAGLLKIEGVPWAASIPVIIMVIMTLVLSKTTWGRHLYAIGGNTEAARRAGINVERTKINAFQICSGMAAVGGLFLADFSGGATTGLGQGDILLFAVAAAVIGGTSLFGGRGRPRDAIIGALVIAIIPNGIHLHNSPEQLNEVITGVVLLIAASVDAISRRRARSS
jgi:D-xylose transport system permease protein